MQALSRLAFGEGNRIGRRLMVMIIGFSSLITLILSIEQLGLEYRDLRSDTDRELDGVTISVPLGVGNGLQPTRNLVAQSCAVGPDHRSERECAPISSLPIGAVNGTTRMQVHHPQ